jgi:DNA-binding transcriptional LysR family regulator
LRELSALPLVSYESSRRPESSLQRAFASADLPMQLAMTAHDADLIKTYVRAGLGVGILAEMAISNNDTDLHALPAPDALPECVTWAVLPRGRVLRDFTLRLLRELAPQIDPIDVRRVVAGNAEPAWPEPPAWSNMSRLRSA